MFDMFSKLPEIYQGIFYIIASTIFLLWILGIITYILVVIIKKWKS
jgi:hypothetical protein